ncbi:MAG TPA: PKD domain-containing protein [Candidatus Thermoplasmatota archaeon]|nr:PKD domain-containing protein [Candidatus Thermoplasmatota archaeon]
MKKKVIDLFVCSLLIATIPTVGALNGGGLQPTTRSSYPLELAHWNQIQQLLVSDDIASDLVVDTSLLRDITLYDDYSVNNLKWPGYETLGDRDNQSPVFGTPSPDNDSHNISLSFTWSISINDTEGDSFTWTIECDNGQKNEEKGDVNGTKSLEISNLLYKTSYTVWVNATDEDGSGNYTKKWYIFNTKDTLPPVFGNPDPENGSTNNPLSFIWSIPINDSEGDEFSWSIQCSNGDVSSGSNELNGTKILVLSSLTFSTTYTVWVNATDPDGSGVFTRRWYTLTTKDNQPPIFGLPNPSNESINNPINFIWNISIIDSEGNTFNWTIQCNNGQFNSGTDEDNGTKLLALSNLAYSTTYIIWVNATDATGSGLWNRGWYTFTTEQENHSPDFGAPSPTNGSANNPINLSWSILISDSEGDTFTWTIQCNNGQSNNSVVGEANGTKTLILSNLANATTYTVWVNATDSGGSGVYTRRWYTFTTKSNQPPIFGSATPSNGSSDRPLSFTWMIPINDLDGNSYDWTIQCSNGQTSSGMTANNGTKTLALSGLAYETTYRVWVNATDPGGSGLYTRRWYTFRTRNVGGTPPEEPPESSNNNPIADASAREPYQGLINTTILFDGSLSYDPDGNITTWLWDFDDNTKVNGMTVYHSFSEAGIYSVTLTVTDNDGASNTDTTTCVISEHNQPPTIPKIDGPTSGTKNTLYTYTASSTDPDNDRLQYSFLWEGSISQPSGFIPSGINYSVNHRWMNAGRYNLTVTVTDNQTESSSKITIYIDAVQTRGAGYLLDLDGDGIYDAFYSDETHQTVSIQRNGDSFLIDKDGDGHWEYVYNATYGLTSYQEPRKTPGYELGFTLCAIAVVILLTRKRKTI